MRRWTKFTAVAGLVAAGLVGVAATPASASETPAIYCDLVVPDLYHYKVTAVAVYEDDVAGPEIRQWKEFRYMIRMLVGGVYTDKNNVNIRLSESGRTKFTLDSPDDRKFGVWYTVRPSRPLYTSVWGPKGAHDHRANDLIEITAIFDRRFEADPSCTAWHKV
jgi:hypothetical protein